MISFHVLLYTKAKVTNKIHTARTPNMSEINDMEAAVIVSSNPFSKPAITTRAPISFVIKVLKG